MYRRPFRHHWGGVSYEANLAGPASGFVDVYRWHGRFLRHDGGLRFGGSATRSRPCDYVVSQEGLDACGAIHTSSGAETSAHGGIASEPAVAPRGRIEAA